MLPTQKNKQTISILEKLRQKGMPGGNSMSPVPTPGDTGDFDQEMSYEEVDALGQALQPSSGITTQTAGGPVKSKQKKPLPGPSLGKASY